MIGDYNSYAMEDPITVIKNARLHQPDRAFLGPDAYSYVFDGQWGYLDHALGSASPRTQVTGVGDYHINADEPSVLDYNTDFKTAETCHLYAPDQFRVSDHDPVMVGLVPNAPPTVDAGGPYSVNEGSSVTVSATGTDPNGDTLTYEWDLDNNGSFETAGQSVSFAPPCWMDRAATRSSESHRPVGTLRRSQRNCKRQQRRPHGNLQRPGLGQRR